jgi:hypothetical protein
MPENCGIFIIYAKTCKYFVYGSERPILAKTTIPTDFAD